MVRRYYELPSLTALATFETVARHRDIKLAAAELNVTPGAVSRQIRALEDEICAPLFVRGQEGLDLTTQGQELYAILSRSFAQTSQAIQRMRGGGDGARITLACTNAIASMWLVPGMGDFWRRHPDITVDHLVSDDERDYRRAEVDLRIRYGQGTWPDETGFLLMDETIFPVCSPEFARKHRDTGTGLLAELSLLQVDWVNPAWTAWPEFLRLVGMAPGILKGKRFSSFPVAIQACMDGQGVALGWRRLIQPLIDEGKLVRFTELEIAAPGSYYVTWNENRTLDQPTLLLRDWLLEAAKRSAD